MQTERRVHNPPHGEPGDNQQSETVVVERAGEELDLVVACEVEAEDSHAHHAHATVAAGQIVELKQKRVEQHAKGKRQHAEENSDVAHAQRPNRQRDQRGRDHHREER